MTSCRRDALANILKHVLTSCSSRLTWSDFGPTVRCVFPLSWRGASMEFRCDNVGSHAEAASMLLVPTPPERWRGWVAEKGKLTFNHARVVMTRCRTNLYRNFGFLCIFRHGVVCRQLGHFIYIYKPLVRTDQAAHVLPSACCSTTTGVCNGFEAVSRALPCKLPSSHELCARDASAACKV
jgi:hypothetical protein